MRRQPVVIGDCGREGKVVAVKEFLRRSLHRNYYAKIGGSLLLDVTTSLRMRLGRRTSNSGVVHSTMSTADSITYIEGLVNSYLTRAGRVKLSGPIAEIGPGDNLGTLLLMLHHGATEVHAIDRYVQPRDAQKQDQVYAALVAKHGIALPNSDEGVRSRIPNLYIHTGQPAEKFFIGCHEYYEGVVSWSVLEHLYDPIGALEAMATAIRPGGFMVHSIDLRDHGMFAGLQAAHPLTFLRVPEFIYRRMTRGRGLPNRVLAHRYRAWLTQSGLTGEILVTTVVGSDQPLGGLRWPRIPDDARIRALTIVTAFLARNRVARVLRDVDPEDLAISGLLLVAFKPERA